MQRWLLQPAPTGRDPRRHQLFIKGSLAEVSLLMGKLGAACGRPDSSSCPEGFDFKLFLHQLDERSREALVKLLEDLVPRRPAAPRDEGGPAPVRPRSKRRDASQTFETFCVGPSNRLARAAAREAAASPGLVHNPLVIRGPECSGKTHLLNAMAEDFDRRWGGGSALLASAAELFRNASAAVQSGQAGAFGASFRTRRALLVDDVHLINSKGGAALAGKIAADFCRRGLQVVIAGAAGTVPAAFLEPQGELSREVLIGPPTGKHIFAAADRFFSRYGFVVAPEALEKLLDELASAEEGFKGLYPWLRRLAALRQAGLDRVFNLSLEPLGATGLLSSPHDLSSGGPKRLALLFPENARAQGEASLDRFLREERRTQGLAAYDAVLSRACPAQGEDASAAAEFCADAACDAAVIADAEADDWTAAAASSRAHAAMAALKGLGISCAAIPLDPESEPDAYLAAHADLLHDFFHESRS